MTGFPVMPTIYVSPRAGAWIETPYERHCFETKHVSPRAGAWIETGASLTSLNPVFGFRPVRGRGLKQKIESLRWCATGVSPRAGAWIETSPTITSAIFGWVSPRAGAWIETR